MKVEESVIIYLVEGQTRIYKTLSKRRQIKKTLRFFYQKKKKSNNFNIVIPIYYKIITYR